MMKKKTVMLAAVAVAAMFLVTGCSTIKEFLAPDEEPGAVVSEDTGEEAPKTVEPVVAGSIGTKTPGCVEIRLTNLTGMDIKGFALLAPGQTADPANLLADGEVFREGEIRDLYYDLSGDAPEAGEEEEETAVDRWGNPILNNGESKEPAQAGSGMLSGYQLILTMENDTRLTLHGFPIEDMKEGELYASGDIGYLVYASKATGVEINTLATEQAVRKAMENDAQSQFGTGYTYEGPVSDKESDEPEVTDPETQEPGAGDPDSYLPSQQQTDLNGGGGGTDTDSGGDSGDDVIYY